MNLCIKALRDFCSPKILTLSFAPTLVSFFLCVTCIIIYGTKVSTWVFSLLPSYLNGEGIFQNVLNTLISLCIYLSLATIAILVSMLVNMFFSIFYTPILVEYVRKQHFSHINTMSFGTLKECLIEFIKSLCLYGVLFILCIPLYFIPLLGALTLFVLGYSFFKRTSMYDIASVMMEYTQFKNLIHSHKARNHFYAFLAYLPSFIPLLSYFLMPFQILLLTHYFFTRLDEEG